jgi:lysozyme family protein
MGFIDQAVSELVAAINVLVRRRANTTDPAEKQVITDAMKVLNRQITFLAQAGLLQAAQTVAAATDELEKVVKAAKTGPFDGFLGEIEGTIRRLFDLQGQMHASENLPSADVAELEPLKPAALKSAQPAAVAAPINSKNYAELKQEYVDYYAACKVRTEFKGNIAYYTDRLNRHKATYQAVGSDLNIPWEFIGIIHGLECGFNFGTHLHNGDPLTARTVHVPAGRPVTGVPPFAWRESARDALMMKGFQHETDWSVPRMLYQWERYNGFGYRRLGIPTPYLWSFSNLYVKGKFTADSHFDPNAVSKQCGAAVMLKALRP